jgi:predicted lipoprotein with Yx(FWY)xxD motif
MRRQLRVRPFVILLGAVVGASVALAAAPGTVRVMAAHNARLNASILVTQGGMTLYHLTAETGTKIACTGACAVIWPPLLVPSAAKPLAGNGISKSKLGTIRRPDGRRQVTYAGLALYRYSGDHKAGDTKGEGFGHVWYAISPSGRIVKSSGGGRRVLLISIDGLHASDLTAYVVAHPDSTLARLAARGTTYRHALTSFPSDSFSGLLAMTTGGTPKSTGVYYDDSYDRRLYPPNSNCTGPPGTAVVYDQSIDRNPKALDGGGIDPTKLPLRTTAGGCVPVYPHSFLRVNTIFNVAHTAGLRTAWSDKHPAYELLNGPSGNGVDDLYTPEIASVSTNTPAIELYDALKVKAIVNEIDGLTSSGTQKVGVPAIFGMNFQAVNVAQKAPSGGYLNGGSQFSAELAGALDFVDRSLGRMVDELRSRGLLATTEIIVTAKHGQSPVNRDDYLKVPPKTIPAIVDSVAAGLTAHATQDDISLLWLSDQSKTDAAVAALRADESGPNTGHITEVIAGAQLDRLFRDPTRDPRVPDVVVQPQHGVIYTTYAGTIAEHGGGTQDDRNVALLVAAGGKRHGPATRLEPITTTQIAPTILAYLGLNPHALQAVQQEHTTALHPSGS